MRSWDDFDRFESAIGAYMPPRGEGETKASQTATAVNKLVYKWYNDGDVYDNTYYMGGWWNDLSSYANWLYENVPYCRDVLDGIERCYTEDEYANLLYELAEVCLDEASLSTLEKEKKVGSIYDTDGKFRFSMEGEDEEW